MTSHSLTPAQARARFGDLVHPATRTYREFDEPGGGTGERFVFVPGFAYDEVTDFYASGKAHDTIDLTNAPFTTLAQVLHHTGMTGGSATIQLGQGDYITLDGVTKAELKAHPHDFAFA